MNRLEGIHLSKDNYAQSARRHLRDSHLLFKNNRFDNTVYLASYTVECTLKLLLSIHLNHSNMQRFGHQITNLHEVATNKLLVIFPQLSTYLHLESMNIDFISSGHPERRYWKSKVYSKKDAGQVLQTADNIYKKSISMLILDGMIPLSEV